MALTCLPLVVAWVYVYQAERLQRWRKTTPKAIGVDLGLSGLFVAFGVGWSSGSRGAPQSREGWEEPAFASGYDAASVPSHSVAW